jgi:hypothetical protein
VEIALGMALLRVETMLEMQKTEAEMVKPAVEMQKIEMVLAETAAEIAATETAAETLVTEMRIMATTTKRTAPHNPVAITRRGN